MSVNTVQIILGLLVGVLFSIIFMENRYTLPFYYQLIMAAYALLCWFGIPIFLIKQASPTLNIIAVAVGTVLFIFICVLAWRKLHPKGRDKQS